MTTTKARVTVIATKFTFLKAWARRHTLGHLLVTFNFTIIIILVTTGQACLVKTFAVPGTFDAQFRVSIELA